MASVFTPNRIVLIARGRYDEAVASADCYPGMLLQYNSTLQMAPAATEGGGAAPLMVAIEDALRGGDITQKLPATYVMPLYRPAKGDVYLMLLQNGQNVSIGTTLVSAGDGTLIANPGSRLYQIVAASTTVTNTNTSTNFSNGVYTIPANLLAAGDTLFIRGHAIVAGQNSTNTHDLKVALGSTTIFDTGALNLAANTAIEFEIQVTIDTVGASGTYVSRGTGAGGTATSAAVSEYVVASTTINTLATNAVAVSVTQSAASLSNQIALDSLEIIQTKTGGNTGIGVALEAINNSSAAGSSPMSGANSGTAAFIRVQTF